MNTLLYANDTLAAAYQESEVSTFVLKPRTRNLFEPLPDYCNKPSEMLSAAAAENTVSHPCTPNP